MALQKFRIDWVEIYSKCDIIHTVENVQSGAGCCLVPLFCAKREVGLWLQG